MSRSEEEWEEARQDALKIRSLLRQAQDLVDEWPVRFSDHGGRARLQLDKALDLMIAQSHLLIGSVTRD